MAPSLVARNYADTLLELARRHGGPAAVDEYLETIGRAADLLRREPRVREFLETPRIGAHEKKRVMRAAFGGRVPEMFLRFLLVLVENRRQALIPQIAEAYRDRVDELMGRVRVSVTLAEEPDAALQQSIATSLERRLGRTVIAQYRVDPALIGGVVVRVGDEVLDGSVRRRAQDMRRNMLSAPLPEPAAVAG